MTHVSALERKKAEAWTPTGTIRYDSGMPDALEPPRFPPVWNARADGLLMLGGQLTTDWLLAAYRQGIFPWPLSDGHAHVLAWFSPDPRAVLELDSLHVSRRLRRRLRSGQFQVSFDTDFAAVVAGCAKPRGPDDDTWITPAMAAAYGRLHEIGYAHSVEVWQQGELVGGLYGVALGGFFSGESMFCRERDASKVALAYLVDRLQERRFVLFDVQQTTPHLRSMGATEISRHEFLSRLKKSLDQPVSLSLMQR